MRFTFWRGKPVPKAAPRLPAWVTAHTEAFRVDEVGRVGRLTLAQEFRANGGQE
ncbi:hypothetical protein ACLQ25_01825 [Micromonospora sp. DT44]|uniref:hypothetical protein n=1 Tax=Micromonospora sp. DT44 TaxID=3393439 RepID=UPI003CED10F6